MDYPTLIAEIKTDPLNRGYASMTADAILSSLRAASSVRVVESRLTELGIIKAVTEATGDPAQGETFMQALEAIGESQSLVKRMLKWLQPGDPGLDMGDPHVRSTLDALVAAGLSAPAVTAIKAVAEVPCSRAEELGISDVGRGHIVSALQLIAGGA